jgi:hypothetical protein
VNAEGIEYFASRREPALVSFYCRVRGHRLFDFRQQFVWQSLGGEWARQLACAEAEKLCPRCKLLNTRPVTTRRGVKVGDSGRWTCVGCGAFLAAVDAIRGRLTLRCRCGEQHAPVPEALAAVALPLALCDPDGNIVEDVPFDAI